jgi:hypothetical protein
LISNQQQSSHTDLKIQEYGLIAVAIFFFISHVVKEQKRLKALQPFGSNKTWEMGIFFGIVGTLILSHWDI